MDKSYRAENYNSASAATLKTRSLAQRSLMELK
jgi:hypothetical protein